MKLIVQSLQPLLRLHFQMNGEREAEHEHHNHDFALFIVRRTLEVGLELQDEEKLKDHEDDGINCLV
ncbi:hypothetical protein R3I93_001212 [Phoxinus phoxinus]|uniref:Uncharacterized protein n=1 Tax=Phoxinus phoxinus TaxID=58324 RepID=A0AAN9DRE2_9TELE